MTEGEGVDSTSSKQPVAKAPTVSVLVGAFTTSS